MPLYLRTLTVLTSFLPQALCGVEPLMHSSSGFPPLDNGIDHLLFPVRVIPLHHLFLW